MKHGGTQSRCVYSSLQMFTVYHRPCICVCVNARVCPLIRVCVACACVWACFVSASVLASTTMYRLCMNNERTHVCVRVWSLFFSLSVSLTRSHAYAYFILTLACLFILSAYLYVHYMYMPHTILLAVNFPISLPYFFECIISCDTRRIRTFSTNQVCTLLYIYVWIYI